MFGSQTPGQNVVQERKEPDTGLEDELEGDGGRGCRHCIGPHQNRPIDDQSPQHPVDEDCQQEREPHGDQRRPECEDERDASGLVVFARSEQLAEVVQADPLRGSAEGRLQGEGPEQCLHRRPVEEHEDDQDFRQYQKIGQKRVPEENAFDHLVRRRRRSGTARRRPAGPKPGAADTSSVPRLRAGSGPCTASGSGATARCLSAPRRRAPPAPSSRQPASAPAPCRWSS